MAQPGSARLGSAQLGLTWLTSCAAAAAAASCLPTYLPPAATLLSLSFRPACVLTTVLPRRDRDVCVRVCMGVTVRATVRMCVHVPECEQTLVNNSGLGGDGCADMPTC